MLFSRIHPSVRMSRSLRRCTEFSFCLALLSHCGEEAPQQEVEPLEVGPVETGGVNLGECSSAWVSLTGGNSSDSEPPVDLLFARGNLFYFRFTWGDQGAASSELVKFLVDTPSRETATRVMVENAFSSPMWVDDGELVFTQSSQVRSVSLSGGDWRVRSSYESPETGDVQWLGVSDNQFYFSRYGKPGAIWRISLQGGPVELFAELGEDWGFQVEPPLVRSAEGLLLNGQRRQEDLVERQVTVVIEANGTVRDLPYPEGAVTRPKLTPTGVIHTIELPPDEDGILPEEMADDADSPAGSEAESSPEQTTGEPLPRVRMWLSPLSGGDAIPFWTERPEDARPDHVESDGETGWFVTATESFNDGYRHDTLWHVRPNVEARRLACNPRPENSRIHTESRLGRAFATGDGSVYLVSSSRESDFWELVKVQYLPADASQQAQ